MSRRGVVGCRRGLLLSTRSLRLDRGSLPTLGVAGRQTLPNGSQSLISQRIGGNLMKTGTGLRRARERWHIAAGTAARPSPR